MLQSFFSSLLRGALLAVLAALTAAVGLGFLTVAAWAGLAPALGPAWTAAILGIGYLLVATILALLARNRRSGRASAGSSPLESLIAGFLHGVQSGGRSQTPAVTEADTKPAAEPRDLPSDR